jgi:hypothetical protein
MSDERDAAAGIEEAKGRTASSRQFLPGKNLNVSNAIIGAKIPREEFC